MRLFKLCVIGVIVCGVAGASWVSVRIIAQYRKARTNSEIAWIALSINRTLTRESWERGYDVSVAVHERFPTIRFNGKQLMDCWGTTYIVHIAHSNAVFFIDIRSAGADGRIGTYDDLERVYQLNDEKSAF